MDVFKSLLNLARQYQKVEILTIVAAPVEYVDHVGQMLIVKNDSAPEGILVNQTFTAQVVEIIETTHWQQPMLIEIDFGGRYRLFWDRLTTRPSALVLGAGHISRPLVDVLALLDFSVTVIDDRPDFSNVTNFPKAERVICENFGKALDKLAIASYTAVIIVTRGHRYDLECLRAIIRCPVQYLGMIGSRHRVRTIIDMLTEEGIPEPDLARLRAPIGLDIGAQTPAEIALSIAAEVLATTRSGTCLPLSTKRRCDNG